jgi:hypothetical protein
MAQEKRLQTITVFRFFANGLYNIVAVLSSIHVISYCPIIVCQDKKDKGNCQGEIYQLFPLPEVLVTVCRCSKSSPNGLLPHSLITPSSMSTMMPLSGRYLFDKGKR